MNANSDLSRIFVLTPSISTVSISFIVAFHDDRVLNLTPEALDFVTKVTVDIKDFFEHVAVKGEESRVLVFPLFDSYHRLLVHKIVEDFPELKSFSIGLADQRRLVVCRKIIVRELPQNATTVKQKRWYNSRTDRWETMEDYKGSPQRRWDDHDDRGAPSREAPHCEPPSRADCASWRRAAAHLSTSDDTPTDKNCERKRKPRKPEVAIYVPRGRRGNDRTPDSRESRPDSRPDWRPDSRPDSRPDWRPDSRPVSDSRGSEERPGPSHEDLSPHPDQTEPDHSEPDHSEPGVDNDQPSNRTSLDHEPEPEPRPRRVRTGAEPYVPRHRRMAQDQMMRQAENENNENRSRELEREADEAKIKKSPGKKKSKECEATTSGQVSVTPTEPTPTNLTSLDLPSTDTGTVTYTSVSPGDEVDVTMETTLAAHIQAKRPSTDEEDSGSSASRKRQRSAESDSNKPLHETEPVVDDTDLVTMETDGQDITVDCHVTDKTCVYGGDITSSMECESEPPVVEEVSPGEPPETQIIIINQKPDPIPDSDKSDVKMTSNVNDVRTTSGGSDVRTTSDVDDVRDKVDLNDNSELDTEVIMNENLTNDLKSNDDVITNVLQTTVNDVIESDVHESGASQGEVTATTDVTMETTVGSPYNESSNHGDDSSNHGNDEEEEEDTWDSLFTDEGDCLHPDMLAELTRAVGAVKVCKPAQNYLHFTPKDPDVDYSKLGHLVEIAEFPKEFQTRDLINVFKDFLSRGFDVKWVDDDHAIGIFASEAVAQDALKMSHPMLTVRPLSKASPQTKTKAKLGTDLLQPYKARPETSISAARRLVSGALGLGVKVSKQDRDKERQKLREAKDRKKKAAADREAAWNGTPEDTN